jgi:hypothetical protein
MPPASGSPLVVQDMAPGGKPVAAGPLPPVLENTDCGSR